MKKSCRILASFLIVTLPYMLAFPVGGSPQKISIKRLRIRRLKIFQVRVGKNIYTCGDPVRGKYIPGSLDKKGGFIPTKDLIAQYKQQLKKAKGSIRMKLLIALNKASRYLKAADPICKKGPPDKNTPTATPEATQTSVPTSTPTSAAPTPGLTATPTIPGGTNCDSQRRTSGFGIPSGLIGYGQNGATLWSSNCSGCHGTNGKRGKDYPTIYGARLLGAMSSVNALLSDTQNAADITADRNCP